MSMSREDRSRPAGSSAEAVGSMQAALSEWLKPGADRPKLYLALTEHVRECARTIDEGFALDYVRQTPDGIAGVAQALGRLARSFDKVVREAGLATGVRGYDDIVSDTLGDGIITELEVYAGRLAEHEREAALERTLRPSPVTPIVSGIGAENYAAKPPAPSKSRGTGAVAPVSTRRGKDAG